MSEQPFVTQLAQNLVSKLKNDLIEQDFEFAQPPHTLFSAKKKGLSLTVYSSLKLVVQGKEKESFITFYLEPEILKTFNYSYPMGEVEQHPRIGIDEAGKGDFFGPLCVAGVFADTKALAQLVAWGVTDSKKLNDFKIEKMARDIKKNLAHTIVQIFPERYNELYPRFGNLNLMLAWGHATCIETLMKQTSCEHVIIDQFAASHVVESALRKKKLQPKLVQKHHGESDLVVAAASILARDAFVSGLKKLGETLGVTLPKGANAGVKEEAKRLYRQFGEKGLQSLVKVHFKTYGEVVNHD